MKVLAKVTWIKQEYYVNEMGDVFLFKNGVYRELPKTLGKRGYYCVTLYNPENQKSSSVVIHRLMKIAFFGTDDKSVWINHKDGDKLNNNLSNLELSNPIHNTHHSILNNFHKGTCLTHDKIFDLRIFVHEHVNEFNLTQLSKMFELTYASTKRILDGSVQGKNLSNLLNKVKLPNGKTVNEVQRAICYIYDNIDKSINSVAKFTKLDFTTVDRIRREISNSNSTTKVYGLEFKLNHK